VWGGYHLAGREAPLFDLDRAARSPSCDLVNNVKDGKVGALVRSDKDLVFFQRHVVTSLEFVGQCTHPMRTAGSRVEKAISEALGDNQ